MTVVWPRIKDANNNNISKDIEPNEEFTDKDTSSLQMEEPVLFIDDSFQRSKNIYGKLYKSKNKLLINRKIKG